MSPPDAARNTETTPEAEHRDHFLRLMLFSASRPGGGPPQPRAERPPGAYTALHQSRGGKCFLPHHGALTRVTPESAAIDVMTDLRRTEAVSTTRFMSIDAANQIMILHRVRALFVIDEDRQVSGMITSTDLMGEKPIRIAHERGIHHDEITVADVMTRANEIETIDLDEVLTARVGDVLATLKFSGRQHAIVTTRPATNHSRAQVCGIFSLSQIARQLGIAQPTHDIGRTFAEIEAAIGA
jgi:hypothetical protein